ncbi:MAG: hypothetical protein ACYTEX_26125, partial [Planctomycetota bacterium]
MVGKASKLVRLFLVVVGVCAILGAFGSAVPITYTKVVGLWGMVCEASPEASRQKRRAYLERMSRPELSGKQVAALLRKEKLIQTKKLYDMTDWYVYHGHRAVIAQVLANRQFEMKITLPEDRAGGSLVVDYTVANGYNGPEWGTDIETLVHRQELHRYAADKATDAHLIYYLVQSPREFKAEQYKLYYGPLLFYDDILAYLRIYANYKAWPT